MSVCFRGPARGHFARVTCKSTRTCRCRCRCGGLGRRHSHQVAARRLTLAIGMHLVEPRKVVIQLTSVGGVKLDSVGAGFEKSRPSSQVACGTSSWANKLAGGGRRARVAGRQRNLSNSGHLARLFARRQAHLGASPGGTPPRPDIDEQGVCWAAGLASG